MSSHPAPTPTSATFAQAFAIQCRVIGAIIMRELHTRYGRENVGYLWMIGEPMLLASVIGALHFQGGGSHYLGNMTPVGFMVLGYTTFILFRGIVNRSAGSLEANAPLLYHRQVTVFDITLARALLEVAGVFLTFVVLWSLLVATGLVELPVRPLLVLAAWGLVFFYALSNSILITAITYENRTIERLVHPYSYFMVGLSGSFFQIEWIPHPFREWLGWVPLTSMFELVRYGMFSGTDLTYFYGWYVAGSTAVITWIGLIAMRRVHERIHLA